MTTKNDLVQGTQIRWLEGNTAKEGVISRRFGDGASLFLHTIKESGVHYRVEVGRETFDIAASLIVWAKHGEDVLLNEETKYQIPALIGLPNTNRNISPQDYKILVVDDNEVDLITIASYLNEFGFKSFTALDGQTALSMVLKEMPDLMLVDALMPGQDGYDVCRQINAMPKTKHIPLILMLLDESAASQAFSAGAVDYLMKPIHHFDLYNRASTHLHNATLSALLRKADMDKDRFMAIIAHDLRGPFHPLLGMAQLMVEQADELSTDDVRQMSESIHRSAKTILQLLENLLQWSMLQMGRIEFNAKKVNLRTTAQETANFLQEVARNKGISLNNYIETDIFARADQNMIAMTLRNLVSNAIKFTPMSGQISIYAWLEAGIVKVWVNDTGVGISEENAAKLFRLDTHHTTVGTNKEKGTGLGLLMCADMIKKHGGTIWVESELGQGTTVYFKVKAWEENG